MIERRYCGFRGAELRKLDDGSESRRVEGYALLFDRESRDLGGIVEVLDRNCLDGVLERSDVKCWLNHDERKGILARRRGSEVPQSDAGNSLELELDSTGLRYAFDAPNTALGDELLEALRRGDVSESSFAFTVKEDKWERLPDGRARRTVLKIDRLWDVSPVYEPAYRGTDVGIDRRGLEELEAQEGAQRDADLEAYIHELEAKINC